MHLFDAGCDISDGRFHIAVSNSNRYENRWQTHRQIGTSDDTYRILQRIIHIASRRTVGLSILRVLQSGCMDAAMDSRHVHHIFNTLSVH